MKIDNAQKRILRDPQKRRAWIRYQVEIRGRSMAQIASDAGVSRQCLYQVFQHPYPRMERVIADALKVQPQELFPERYGADGLPNRKIGRPKKSLSKNITRRSDRNVHGRRADEYKAAA